jgi:hypothetical protein
MKPKPLTFLLSLTFLFLFSGFVYGDDYDDAIDAYKRKDYKEAVRLYRLSAEQGDPDAQYNLGQFYLRGELGVPQDYKEAVKWYRKAAEQYDVDAQSNLGFMYNKGQGVPQDYVIAHMWFNLCGSIGVKDCVKNRDIIQKRMSPQQIEKAQEMARNWKPTKK